MHIGPENEERVQELEIDGLVYRLKAADPYGFVKVTCITKNKTLDGQFTSFGEATKAANQHASSIKKDK